MHRRRPNRIPRRALAPFLLFWCLGSFVLGQELGHEPALALASSFAQPLHVRLAPIGPIASAASSSAASSSAAPAPVRQLANGLLGAKPIIPAPPKKARPTRPSGRKAAPATARSKKAALARAGLARSSRSTPRPKQPRGMWPGSPAWAPDCGGVDTAWWDSPYRGDDGYDGYRGHGRAWAFWG